MEYGYIGVDIGGTNLRIGVVDEAFQTVEFEKIPTAGLAAAGDKTDYLRDRLSPYIEKYGRERIRAVSFALASLMDRERTRIYSSPMIPGFEQLPLVELLEEKTGVRTVIEKDVNLLLLYEIWKNRLPERGIVAGTFLGTGLGNAMCIDGRIYPGNSGTACELGHIPVPGLSGMCGCGKKGCVELLSCGRLLHRLAQETFSCPVEQIFVLHGEDARVRSVVSHCALAIAAEITILDPVCMILGGGVMEMEDFPMEELIREVRDNLRIPNPRDSVRFLKASGDSHAGVVGAALHAAALCR